MSGLLLTETMLEFEHTPKTHNMLKVFIFFNQRSVGYNAYFLVICSMDF